MADFLFVHGAWHGAWCWNELIPELERLGHAASAIDLPGGGADPTPLGDVSLDACAETIAEAVRRRPGRVWLVGHSLGGASITQAADRLADRLAALVYVAAGVPGDGQSMADVVRMGADSPESSPSLLQAYITLDFAIGGVSLPPEHARESLYHLCSDAQVERALAHLRRWQALGPGSTPVRISPERGGRVPRYYVEALHDRAIPLDLQRRMHDAVGMRDVAAVSGDHSPFLSCPADLARALDGFARDAEAGPPYAVASAS